MVGCVKMLQSDTLGFKCRSLCLSLLSCTGSEHTIGRGRYSLIDCQQAPVMKGTDKWCHHVINYKGIDSLVLVFIWWKDMYCTCMCFVISLRFPVDDFYSGNKPATLMKTLHTRQTLSPWQIFSWLHVKVPSSWTGLRMKANDAPGVESGFGNHLILIHT